MPTGTATGTVGAGATAPRRVVVDARDLGGRPDDVVRLLLVADVCRRAVEDLHGGQVRVLVLGRQGESPGPSVATAARAMGIRDAPVRLRSSREVSALGGPVDLVLEPGERDGAPGPLAATSTVRVGSTTMPGPAGGRSHFVDLLVDHDPLALRLALLRFRPASRAAVSSARLHRADETLYRWRVKVAGWADMPSAPAPADRVDAVGHALLPGLDTEAVLTLLHRVELEPHLASGSKFEVFAWSDRTLGLDLRHLVGKLRG